ncbi:hypothetical protein SDC9_80620 [bioreactor metagenome]|uniref:Uncharacterized protein n=1 Tax=bioreactor metagenome TaxID=1076179 RepID=A0A644Z0G9_9ZZZZ
MEKVKINYSSFLKVQELVLEIIQPLALDKFLPTSNQARSSLHQYILPFCLTQLQVAMLNKQQSTLLVLMNLGQVSKFEYLKCASINDEW